MNQPAISIQNLHKRYQHVWAVHGLNLIVEPGEVFALVGPNGAGKTTTIKILLGLTPPTSGEVTVLGLDPQRQVKRLRAQTGYAMQQIALDLYLTARENLSVFADLFNLPASEKEARISEMLAWAELSDAADRLVQTYSGGMRRRLNLVLSLLHRPQLLFLDEPTLGLDVYARRKLWDLIRDIKATGTTIILTTHYLEEANTLCDRIGIMAQGQLVAQGTPEYLKHELADDLHRLSVTFDHLPSLKALDLPLPPAVEGNQISFVGPHALLWKTLGLIQTECGELVREASYLQPSLDDVVLKIAKETSGENALQGQEERK